MTLAEIRPLLVAALIGLAALSMVRSNLLSGGHRPVRIPVRFEPEGKPQRVDIHRLVN